MNQKRTTKQALVLSVLSIMLCFCMLIGSTFAWFTDSVSSDKNTIVAGNLDIELDYLKNGEWTTVEGQSDIFDPTAKWEPGHAEVAYLKVSNAGNLALKYILNVALTGETVGTNVNGERFKLSDYLMFDIVENIDGKTAAFADRAAAIAACPDAKTLRASLIGNNHGDGFVTGTLTPADNVATTDEKYVAVVIWMPKEIQNEANPMPGSVAPFIDLGVSVVATQIADGADLPTTGTGTDILTGLENHITIEVRGEHNQKVATFQVPKGALADETADVKATVDEVPARTGNFTVQAGETVKSYEVEMTNIKAGNGEKIIAKLRIEDAGVYVAKEDIKIYHNGSPVDEDDIIGYNHNNGYVSFYTTSFSPFDVIYKTSEMPANMVFDSTPTPNAGLAPMESYAEGGADADIEWGEAGGFGPDYSIDADPTLETVYTFTAPEGAEDSPFANWFCDFYVSLDTDLGQNQIFLGGCYGEWGWIGFHNGDFTVKANEFVPMLGTVGMQWMYKEVAAIVGNFMCGVSGVGTELDGQVFTLQLRLINPNDASDYRIVTQIQHTFGADMSTDVILHNVPKA